MKHLKIYEDWIDKLNYNIDDYILLNMETISYNIENRNDDGDVDDFISNKAKIIEIIDNEEHHQKKQMKYCPIILV